MPHVTLPRSSQNLRMYYELFGTGENKVLFIMGLLTEGAAWSRQVNQPLVGNRTFGIIVLLDGILRSKV